MRRFLFRGWVIALAASLLALAAAEGLYRHGAMMSVENLYGDLWHRIAGQRQTPKHVALVMVDDPSLNDYPDDPLVFWTPYFAKAIGTLKAAGAKSVAVDFLFSGNPERWIEKLGEQVPKGLKNYDLEFRQRINQSEVQLSGFKVGEGRTVDDFILPNPDYLLSLPNMDVPFHIGLVNLRSDIDGPVRRFVLVEAADSFVLKEGMPRLSFGALAAARATGQGVGQARWNFGGRELSAEDPIRIRFAGPPGTFQAVSFRRLLAPTALDDPEVKALAGKVVVIGAGYAGMNDVHPVPYSTGLFAGTNTLMPGPEIQANIIETLLGGRFVDDVPDMARMLVFATVFVGLAFAVVGRSFLATLGLFVLTAALSALGAYGLFRQDFLFPLAHLHGGMLVILICLSGLRLTRAETQRRQLNQMFGRYVSPQLMSAMLKSDNPPELGGQARLITVLFSDIRGFTTLSEKLSPPEVVELLNTYFERACSRLMAEGATIDKFIGDAIMAEFGAPLEQSDHALRGVRGALALREVAVEFRQWFRQRFPDRGLHEFDIGIGVHTGVAVVGNVGSSAIMEYTAIGDTVNIASRLEGMTKELGCPILASRDTVDAAGYKVKKGAWHSIQVKGREQPVQVYEILGVEA